jgi:hypothetical protein
MTDPFKPYRPCEKRFVLFEHRPDDKQLGTDLGYGLMGASNRTLSENDKRLQYLPQPIPLPFVAVCLAIPLLMLLGYLIWQGFEEREPLAMLILGIFIVPIMIALFAWLNAMEGDEPFLDFEKSTGVLELPRVSMSFPKSQLREVVFLDRFVQGNRHWQVALLVEEQTNRWTYVHLFNEAGTGFGMQWLGVKDTYQKIAEALEVESRQLKFSKAESQELAG